MNINETGNINLLILNLGHILSLCWAAHGHALSLAMLGIVMSWIAVSFLVEEIRSALFSDIFKYPLISHGTRYERIRLHYPSKSINDKI